MINLRGNRKSRRYLSKVLRKISTTKLRKLIQSPCKFTKYLAKFGIILTFSNSALANPEGGVVVEGNATINNPTDTYMRIDQSSQKAVINWQDFSIDAGDHTHFAQPNASAITLNRVVTSIPSEIYGKMTAVGQVMLINQNGILFGAGTQVDVSGLVASTSDISNADFMSDNFDFGISGKADAAITNDGNINIHNAGSLAFVAPQVASNGIISAHLGNVSLAAGDKWVLDMGGEVKLAVEEPIAGYLIHTGHLSASGGKIMLSSNVVQNLVQSAINVSGTIEASSVGMQNGEIVLFAGDGSGGVSGDVMVSGHLDVSGMQAGQTGGDITIAGGQVAVYGSSHINADGDAGGGTILIGGDYQGGGDMPTATNAFVGADAKITANAVSDGDGGKVIVWADDTTQFHGAIEAKGGSISGDGGLVETSGKQTLSLNGTVDASSPNGEKGSWLLDPNNVTIQDAGSNYYVTTSPTFTTNDNQAYVTTASIESALDGGTDVIITTSTGGSNSELGDIRVNNNIEKTAGGDATLTLNAHNRIIIQSGADITSTSNKLNVTLNADSDNSGAGSVLIDSGSVITTNGGYIYIGGGSDVLNDGAVGTGSAGTNDIGVILDNAQLNTGVGNVSIRGTGYSSAGNGHGIYVYNGSKIQTTTGTITLNGKAGDGDGYGYGILINGASTSITSSEGNISITGTGGDPTDPTSDDRNVGIMVDGAAIVSTGTGVNAATISLLGTGGVGDNINHGVDIRYSASVTSVDGAIDIKGYGGSVGGASSDRNYGVVLYNSTITSTGTGSNAATITINGVGGNADGYNHGVYAYDSDISSVAGDVAITGTGRSSTGSDGSAGIMLRNSSTITSTGTGSDAAKITLNGTGAGDRYWGQGIYMRGNGVSITSVDGDISLTGQGADGDDYNKGIELEFGATISSTGTGADAATITLNGTGGDGDNNAYGVYMRGSSASKASITSVAGDISITGNAGDGDYDAHGISLKSGAYITSTGTGSNAAKITLNGTGGEGYQYGYGVYMFQNTGDSVQITSVDGDISITGTGGNSTGLDGSAGVNISNGADITSTGTGSNAAKITLNGTGGDNGGYYQTGVLVAGTGTTITSIDGDIAITGTGGDGYDYYNYGIKIYSGADIISSGTGSNAATITLNGTGGDSDGYNIGVFITNSGTSITSVDGDISITGQGANGSDAYYYNPGIMVSGGSNIISSGTGVNAARITLNGTGADGSYENYGVTITNTNTLISSVDGDINITGTGGDGDRGENIGITVKHGADIISTGTGQYAATITLNGTGGNGTYENFGVAIRESGTNVTSVDGDISITGTANGTGVDNNGFYFYNSANISSSGAANIILTGSTNTTGSGNAFKVVSGSNTLGSSSMTGNITITTDDLNLANLTVENTGSKTIQSKTAPTTIGIGDGTTGDLHVSDAELALFTTNGFTFGNSSGSGKLTVKGNTWADDITLQSGTGEIALSGTQSLGSNDLTIKGGSLTGGQNISANNITIDVDGAIDTGDITSSGNTKIDGGSVTGSNDITANSIIIDVSDGVDVGTLTSTGATTVSFDNDNSGSATVDIGSINSGGDITIADGAGSGNIVRTSGAVNAGTANASIKADNINLMDILTSNIITLDATGSVTAEVSTDNVLNLAASSATLTGKINGGTGLQAAIYGINTLNFTGGSSNFTFGSFKIGFDKTDISNKVQSYGKNFASKSFDTALTFNSIADSFDLQIDYSSGSSSGESATSTDSNSKGSSESEEGG